MDMEKNDKISVCIIAGNEECGIRRCLDSVKWADEIIVVDSFSRDMTAEIAREYTNRVYQHRWLGYIAQKALVKSLAKNEWVMFVDADEEVSKELQDEITGIFSSPIPDEVAGFDFPRLVWFLGRWIRHGEWYPDTKLRLFRRNRGVCAGTEPHDRIDVQGIIRHLKCPLNHYTYDDIADQLLTMNRFSTISAIGKSRTNIKHAWFGMVFHSPYRFIRCYFIKRGFLDGMPGLIIAAMVAFGVFVKYAKLWEIRRCGSYIEE